ncbi:MAG: hypothetical protein ACAI25_16610, partial [Planctomycetota bacterium]
MDAALEAALGRGGEVDAAATRAALDFAQRRGTEEATRILAALPLDRAASASDAIVHALRALDGRALEGHGGAALSATALE